MVTKRGFTLVELLIVIALLGVIALVVIAAINPIEQANRARDTRFRSDAAQMVAAIDRYFTQNNEFPWVTTGAVNSNDAAYGYVTASNEAVGVCGASCSVDGVLLTSDELKSEFRSRDFIEATLTEKQLFVGKGQGTSESIFACYIPASKANREKSVAEGNVYHIDASSGQRTNTNDCDADAADWVNTGGGCFVCVPE